MNEQLMKYWGNFLSTQNGRKQAEDPFKWMNQGLKGWEDLTGLFMKSWGLAEQTGDAASDYLQVWKKAQDEFSKAFKTYMNLLGGMTRNEHLALLGKYEELKQKAASQQETIKHLRMLLAEAKDTPPINMTKQFEELLKKQSEQFQKQMENIGEMLKREPSQPVESREPQEQQQ
ncbi:MAG: hypothetical protein ACLGPL_00220 [Acidobacteriota bacterium]